MSKFSIVILSAVIFQQVTIIIVVDFHVSNMYFFKMLLMVCFLWL